MHILILSLTLISFFLVPMLSLLVPMLFLLDTNDIYQSWINHTMPLKLVVTIFSSNNTLFFLLFTIKKAYKTRNHYDQESQFVTVKV